ncbi:hypothetical protein [Cellulomonas dongxiuzhuiae]|uniref:Uncharacterized protein n=1 Tax=Cellulomonas dongxiuzhuiae TaxID=2819979 RepID=A0ABX8GLW0_9CELL|nr:hypothetical protein [Cellulomonas dongxiuzhuiae]MBO3095851.1 hypothetical protein [Cellulomonas dongxiuzhuiae]QWC17157.1 hypothetical protein KKR89_06025 [Cellulomonas dongxiuzhuiae]
MAADVALPARFGSLPASAARIVRRGAAARGVDPAEFYALVVARSRAVGAPASTEEARS